MGYKKVLENLSWESWKVLDFFVSKRLGTLSVLTAAIGSDHERCHTAAHYSDSNC